MDGNRPGALRNAAKAFRETLSDEALDRELDAALNAEPSPEFVARVRMRVASEPAAGPWWASWKLVTAAACVVLLGVAAAVWSRQQPMSPAGPGIATDRTLPPAALEPAPVSPVAEPVPLSASSTVSSRASRVEASGRRATTVPADEIVMTEVIASEDDRRSFEALLLAIQQQRLPPLTPSEGAVEQLPEPAPIEIAEVIIEPVEISRFD